MPIAAAAPVCVLMPTSWSASPRLRVMSSPGLASDPIAMIQMTSGLRSIPSARSILISAVSAGDTDASGTTSSVTPSTLESTTVLRTRRSTRPGLVLIRVPALTWRTS